MFTLPEPLEHSLAGRSIAPHFLIETTLDTLRRYSTFGDTTYDSSVWKGGVAELRSIDAWETVGLRLDNSDGALTATLLDGQWRNNRCRVWQARADAPIFFGFRDSIAGWSLSNATDSGAISGGALHATKNASAGSLHFVGPASQSVNGAQYRYVAVRIRCMNGSISKTVQVMYVTGSHSFSTSYRKDVVATLDGQWRTLIFDMHDLTAGSTDWSTETITQYRISIVSLTGSEDFEVDWIALATGVRGEGVAPPVGPRWRFGSSVEGWTISGGTLTAAGGRLVATKVGAGNMHVVSPATTIEGRTHNRLFARMRASTVPATLQAFYANAGHSFSTSYMKSAPVLPKDGLRTIEFDMLALTAGGNDWRDSITTAFRFSFTGYTGGEVVEIEDVWIDAPIDEHALFGREVVTALVFDGQLDAASAVFPAAELTATRGLNAGRPVPSIRFVPPLANHCPASGTVIKWQADSLELTT